MGCLWGSFTRRSFTFLAFSSFSYLLFGSHYFFHYRLRWYGLLTPCVQCSSRCQTNYKKWYVSSEFPQLRLVELLELGKERLSGIMPTSPFCCRPTVELAPKQNPRRASVGANTMSRLLPWHDKNTLLAAIFSYFIYGVYYHTLCGFLARVICSR